MLVEPRCSERNCKHFLGVRLPPDQEEFGDTPDEPELGQFVYCAAFPGGIPDEIAYGDNLHLEPFTGDNGIQYERDPEDEAVA